MREERGDRLTLVSSGSAATEAERARRFDLDWTILMRAPRPEIPPHI